MYASGSVTIEGYTQINITGKAEYQLNGDFSIGENAVVSATATAERGVDGDIAVYNNAKVTSLNATQRGVYGDMIVKDNAAAEISGGEYGIYGDLNVEGNAIVKVTSGTNHVLRYNPVVKPAVPKVYKIKNLKQKPAITIRKPRFQRKIHGATSMLNLRMKFRLRLPRLK